MDMESEEVELKHFQCSEICWDISFHNKSSALRGIVARCFRSRDQLIPESILDDCNRAFDLSSLWGRGPRFSMFMRPLENFFAIISCHCSTRSWRIWMGIKSWNFLGINLSSSSRFVLVCCDRDSRSFQVFKLGTSRFSVSMALR
jgi:hypothetical protein